MLYITYDIDGISDGMGAQYQRIVGILCIANYYNLKYTHTSIESMEHVSNPSYLKNIEDYFQIENNYENVNAIIYDEIFQEYNPYIDDLMKYRTNKNILVKIVLPFHICDSNTTIYSVMMPKLRTLLNFPNVVDKNSFFLQTKPKVESKENSEFQESNSEEIDSCGDKMKIAIHVRRGNVTMKTYPDRYVPISQVQSIINIIKNTYTKICIFYLFTEIDENNINEFDIFKDDPHIIIRANEDPLITLNSMIHSDILVISKSSFSYLAGLYHNKIVYYFKFWHNPLSNWISV